PTSVEGPTRARVPRCGRPRRPHEFEHKELLKSLLRAEARDHRSDFASWTSAAGANSSGAIRVAEEKNPASAAALRVVYPTSYHRSGSAPSGGKINQSGVAPVGPVATCDRNRSATGGATVAAGVFRAAGGATRTTDP